jgi:minor histocompatibility antigen H13
MFPVLAGGTLASLYFILKWLQDPAWLNWALGLYFSQIGLFFAAKFLKDAFTLLRSFLLPNQFSRSGELWKVDQQAKCFKTDSGKSTSSPFAGPLGRIPLPSAVSLRIWDIRGLLYAKAQFELHVHRLITLKAPVEILDVLSLTLSCSIVYYHTFIGKPWFLTNFLGFSFCYGSLQYVTPTTAWTGTLILGALFFYDIYFVFFTPMMVTVATKLDVPIKLLFPRPDGCVMPVGAPEGSPAMEEYLKCLAKKRTMAMLGLGDIVVPGMVLAFALRFDLYLHYRRQGHASKQGKETETTRPTYTSAKGSWGERFWTSSKLWPEEIRAKQFPKPYLYATIVGYLFGMVVTVVVMQVAQHAQPALLYLVPGVLGSLWGTALVKGDLKTLWNYSEMPESEKEDKSKVDAAETNKEALGSSWDVAEDETTAADGQVDDEDKGSKQQKSQAGKKDSEKTDRRLVYLSITMPNTSHKHDSKPSTESKAVLEGSKHTLAVEGRRSDDRSTAGILVQDDEPPGNEPGDHEGVNCIPQNVSARRIATV